MSTAPRPDAPPEGAPVGSRQLLCDPTCSDAELYDLLFHYRRIHGLLVRYRPGDGGAITAIEGVLGPPEAEAKQRGIPLHRLPV